MTSWVGLLQNLALLWVTTTRPGFFCLNFLYRGSVPNPQGLFWFHTYSVRMGYDLSLFSKERARSSCSSRHVKVSFPPLWNRWKSQRGGGWYLNIGEERRRRQRGIVHSRILEVRGDPLFKMQKCMPGFLAEKKKALEREKSWRYEWAERVHIKGAGEINLDQGIELWLRVSRGKS